MSAWRCPRCGRFLANARAAYVAGSLVYWSSHGDCNVHGEVSPLAAWEELWGEDFDPEDMGLPAQGPQP